MYIYPLRNPNYDNPNKLDLTIRDLLRPDPNHHRGDAAGRCDEDALRLLLDPPHRGLRDERLHDLSFFESTEGTMGGVLDWTAASLQPHSPGRFEERHLGRDRYNLRTRRCRLNAFVEGNQRSFIKLKLTLDTKER